MPPFDESLSLLTPATEGTTATTSAMGGMEELIASLEQETAPTQKKMHPAQLVLGAISDALIARENIRMGRPAVSPGPFAQRRMAMGQSQRDAEQAAATSNRDMRNRIRIGQFERTQEQAGAEALAKLRPPSGYKPRIMEMRGADGKLYLREVTFDPTEGAVLGDTLGRGFVPDSVQNTSIGLVTVNKEGEGAKLVPNPMDPTKSLRPAPGEETQRAVGSAAGFLSNLASYEKRLPAFLDKPARQGALGTAKRIGQQIGRDVQIPFTGVRPFKAVSAYVDQEGELLARDRDRISADVTRLMSGLQASDNERQSILALIPGTADPDSAFAADAFKRFREGYNAFIRERARLRPDLFTTESLKKWGVEDASIAELQNYLTSGDVPPPPRPGTRRIKRSMIGNASAAQRLVIDRKVAAGEIEIIEGQ